MQARGGDERPIETLAVGRLRAVGERARQLATEVLAAVEELETLALELAAAQGELSAPRPPEEQSPSTQVLERLQRLTGQQRALIAEAVERRQQLQAAGLLPAGEERRTFRVIPPSDESIVVQVRAPGERRRAMSTYVLSPEELQQLLPPEDEAEEESPGTPVTVGS